MANSSIALDTALHVAQVATATASDFLKEFVATNQIQNKTFKNDGSPVTRADTAAQHIVITILKKHFPEIPIVAEEDRSDSDAVLASEYCWFVDPLDGTKEFVKGSEEFTVNIALVHNKKPVVGVISIPLWDEQYYAAKGMGSFKKSNKGVEKITVSKNDLEMATIAVSKDHSPREQQIFIESLPHQGVVQVGSSIKGCYVAAGRADLYIRFNPFWYWDVCAQDCIVREAGGVCSTISGEAISYEHQRAIVDGVIIANAHIHSTVIEQLAQFRI